MRETSYRSRYYPSPSFCCVGISHLRETQDPFTLLPKREGLQISSKGGVTQRVRRNPLRRTVVWGVGAVVPSRVPFLPAAVGAVVYRPTSGKSSLELLRASGLLPESKGRPRGKPTGARLSTRLVRTHKASKVVVVVTLYGLVCSGRLKSRMGVIVSFAVVT